MSITSMVTVSITSITTTDTRPTDDRRELAEDAPDPARCRLAAARAACQTCHALAACDSYATAANEPAGVWGGRDREPRRRPKGAA